MKGWSVNRKQQQRAQEKYNRGLKKELDHTDFDKWGKVLDDALHHILKNCGQLS